MIHLFVCFTKSTVIIMAYYLLLKVTFIKKHSWNYLRERLRELRTANVQDWCTKSCFFLSEEKNLFKAAYELISSDTECENFLQRSEIKLSKKRSECERSNASRDRSKRV